MKIIFNGRMKQGRKTPVKNMQDHNNRVRKMVNRSNEIVKLYDPKLEDTTDILTFTADLRYVDQGS